MSDEKIPIDFSCSFAWMVEEEKKHVDFLPIIACMMFSFHETVHIPQENRRRPRWSESSLTFHRDLGPVFGFCCQRPSLFSSNVVSWIFTSRSVQFLISDGFDFCVKCLVDHGSLSPSLSFTLLRLIERGPSNSFEWPVISADSLIADFRPKPFPESYFEPICLFIRQQASTAVLVEGSC